ncbi:MAG: hypothetical protein JF886_01710 [Candidatus Dormibacteraeota bacterium]|uniref:Uncharacterized protein n=1 Tax=Candidatus Aeolococcus gillhamiae TaxID=3127015 RepID=A0A934N2F6_9BACT|nr:hypothetical protein [Candidatus Dormibacteraeota bacterium]
MIETLIDRVIWRQTWLAKVAVPVQGAVGTVYGQYVAVGVAADFPTANCAG